MARRVISVLLLVWLVLAIMKTAESARIVESSLKEASSDLMDDRDLRDAPQEVASAIGEDKYPNGDPLNEIVNNFQKTTSKLAEQNSAAMSPDQVDQSIHEKCRQAKKHAGRRHERERHRRRRHVRHHRRRRHQRRHGNDDDQEDDDRDDDDSRDDDSRDDDDLMLAFVDLSAFTEEEKSRACEECEAEKACNQCNPCAAYGGGGAADDDSEDEDPKEEERRKKPDFSIDPTGDATRVRQEVDSRKNKVRVNYRSEVTVSGSKDKGAIQDALSRVQKSIAQQMESADKAATHPGAGSPVADDGMEPHGPTSAVLSEVAHDVHAAENESAGHGAEEAKDTAETDGPNDALPAPKPEQEGDHDHEPAPGPKHASVSIGAKDGAAAPADASKSENAPGTEVSPPPKAAAAAAESESHPKENAPNASKASPPASDANAPAAPNASKAPPPAPDASAPAAAKPAAPAAKGPAAATGNAASGIRVNTVAPGGAGMNTVVHVPASVDVAHVPAVGAPISAPAKAEPAKAEPAKAGTDNHGPPSAHQESESHPTASGKEHGMPRPAPHPVHAPASSMRGSATRGATNVRVLIPKDFQSSSPTTVTVELGHPNQDCPSCVKKSDSAKPTEADGAAQDTAPDCPNSCSGHGTCSPAPSAPGVFLCECDVFYGGDDCSMYCPLKCNEHGTCVVGEDGTNSCECEAGWEGEECEIPTCEKPCSAHGKCNGETHTCACNEGWLGDQCDVTCPGGPDDICGGRGLCMPTGQCKCDEGWRGPGCTDECPGGAQNACNNHGTCEDDATCVCKPGFHGRSCALDAYTCHENQDCIGENAVCVDGRCSHAGLDVSCSQHGDCTTGHCVEGVCKEWRGGRPSACKSDSDCSATHSCAGGRCVPSPKCGSHCSGHGKCDPWKGSCVCDEGFRGDDCSIACPANCTAHGVCTPAGTCMCKGGWSGPACEIECEGGHENPCSGHGNCLPEDGRCECHDGYAGRACVQSVKEIQEEAAAKQKAEDDAKEQKKDQEHEQAVAKKDQEHEQAAAKNGTDARAAEDPMVILKHDAEDDGSSNHTATAHGKGEGEHEDDNDESDDPRLVTSGEAKDLEEPKAGSPFADQCEDDTDCTGDGAECQGGQCVDCSTDEGKQREKEKNDGKLGELEDLLDRAVKTPYPSGYRRQVELIIKKFHKVIDHNECHNSGPLRQWANKLLAAEERFRPKEATADHATEKPSTNNTTEGTGKNATTQHPAVPVANGDVRFVGESKVAPENSTANATAHGASPHAASDEMGGGGGHNGPHVSSDETGGGDGHGTPHASSDETGSTSSSSTSSLGTNQTSGTYIVPLLLSVSIILWLVICCVGGFMVYGYFSCCRVMEEADAGKKLDESTAADVEDSNLGMEGLHGDPRADGDESDTGFYNPALRASSRTGGF